MVNAFKREIRPAGLIVFCVLKIGLIYQKALWALQTCSKGTNTVRSMGIGKYQGTDFSG
jgi:hypothetical protein